LPLVPEVQVIDLCVADALERIARQMGYSHVTHTLEIFGICPSARRTRRAAMCELARLRLRLDSLRAVGRRSEARRTGDLPNADALRAAADYSAGHRGTALLVIHGGPHHPRRVLEIGQIAANEDLLRHEGVLESRSACAQEDGILDLDERVALSISEWSSEVDKSSITIRELLNFSAGLNDAFALHNDGWKDRAAHAIKQARRRHARQIVYLWPCCAAGLSRGPQEEARLEGRIAYAFPRAPASFVRLDSRGNGTWPTLPVNPLLAAGFTMTATDWARMGKAILRDGAPPLRRGMGEAFSRFSSESDVWTRILEQPACGLAGSREVDRKTCSTSNGTSSTGRIRALATRRRVISWRPSAREVSGCTLYHRST
jgi:hypothetical protein